jgi:hypothetical protein
VEGVPLVIVAAIVAVAIVGALAWFRQDRAPARTGRDDRSAPSAAVTTTGDRDDGGAHGPVPAPSPDGGGGDGGGGDGGGGD